MPHLHRSPDSSQKRVPLGPRDTEGGLTVSNEDHLQSSSTSIEEGHRHHDGCFRDSETLREGFKAWG